MAPLGAVSHRFNFNLNLQERDHWGGLGVYWEDSIRTDLKEIGIDMRNLVASAQDSSCEWWIEPPGSISHGVSLFSIALSSIIPKVPSQFPLNLCNDSLNILDIIIMT